MHSRESLGALSSFEKISFQRSGRCDPAHVFHLSLVEGPQGAAAQGPLFSDILVRTVELRGDAGSGQDWCMPRDWGGGQGRGNKG